MSKLKPCPFCGATIDITKALHKWTITDDYSVWCPNTNCDARVEGPFRAIAIRRWNKRAKEKP